MNGRTNRRVVFIILFAALLIAGFLTYAKAVGIYNHAMAVRWYIQDLESLSKTPEFLADATALQRVQAELGQMRLELAGLRSETEWFIFMSPYLEWVPGVGHDLAAFPKLLEMGDHLAAGGQNALIALQPLLETLNSIPPGTNPGDSFGVRLLPVLAAQKETLAHAAQELDQAAALRHGIQADQLSPAIQDGLNRSDRLVPGLQTALQAALVAPSLLGADRPMTYLLVAQSNNELRATGGLISAVGPITLDRGRIIGLPFERGVSYYDDLAKRHPPPPAAFFKYMNAGIWYMRDANWSPDFPTTARTIEAFYQLDTGVRVDGVIAFDVVMAPWILQAIGPVEVPEFQEKVDATNLLTRVEFHWDSARYTPGEGQKDFMGAVLKAAILKINQGQGIPRSELLAVIRRGLTEKHLLVYLHDQNLAASLGDSHWDGALNSAPADFLMVVDSNLGYNKVNANVTQTMEYAVDLREPLQPRASLTMTYINGSTLPVEQCIRWPPVETTYARAKQGCYWDYLRLYVPLGSQLVGASGLNEPLPILDTPEGEKTVFATFMILSPGERRQIRFDYGLPPSVVNSSGEYRLFVQKQSGTLAMPFRFRLALPVGTGVLSAESNMSPADSDPAAIAYDADLSVDRSLSLKLQFPANRIEFQPSNWLWILIPTMGLILMAAGVLLRRANQKSNR